jgi:hypothetical protein
MNTDQNEWPFVIMHNGHEAWYQRALLMGDFAPGLKPLPNYVITLTGEPVDPYSTPKCGTCKGSPATDDLLPVERATGRSNFLEAFRSGQIPWEKAGRTKAETCFYCNGGIGLREVSAELLPERKYLKPTKKNKTIGEKLIKCCETCVALMSKKE